MLRHVSIISAISRNLVILNTASASLKCDLRSNIIHCAKFRTSACTVARKMGDSQSHESVQSGLSDNSTNDRPGKIKLSDKEWKSKLTDEEYSVTRKHGTEMAFTGELLNNKAKGMYVCTCCGAELFSSSAKFDSGSGWPSFSAVQMDKDMPNMPAVDTVNDISLGMKRVEVRCGKCDAHLGHVFDDGPTPSGQRYCINSVCMKFKPDGSKK